MSTVIQYESTLHGRRTVGSDGDYVTPAPTGEEDPGPEDDGCASCSQIKPTISHTHTHTHIHTHTYIHTVWLTRVYMNTEMPKTQHGTHTHTDTYTLQSALCLDNLTENHHGN